MSAAAPPSWLARPGLAGGIDKDGSRAAELLGLGFGSVEFGTVTARPLPGHNPGAPALAAALEAVSAQLRPGAAIGVGLGLPPDLPASGIAGEWAAALAAVWPIADYVSFNLSAAASRRFLAAEYLGGLETVFRVMVALAGDLAKATGRRLSLALKIPLGEAGQALPAAGLAAVAAGFDRLTAVLPSEGERFGRLRALVDRLPETTVVVAVGGIRNAADVAAARAAGARGIQVHRLFAEQGAACLRALQ